MSEALEKHSTLEGIRGTEGPGLHPGPSPARTERSSGSPEKRPCVREPDLRAALDYLAERPDVDPNRIGGLGLSVGGELMLQTAAHNPALRAVVSEGAGSRSFKESLVTPGLGKWLAGPYGITTMLATAVFSNGMPPDKLHDLVDDIAPRPVFLIFATKGQGGENTLNDQYYAHAGQPKELWEIPDAKHVGGLEAHPVEYERRVVGFFGRALLPRGSP